MNLSFNLKQLQLALVIFFIGLPAALADFAVERGTSNVVDRLITTSARLNLTISGEPEVALSKGIGLMLEVQTELHRSSLASIYFEVAAWKDRYLIEYQGLSNRFTLTRLGTGSTQHFATLSETLSSFTQYRSKLPLPEGVSTEDELQIHLRVILDRGQLPGPLRLIALIFPEWRLDSSWGRWPVNVP